LKLNILFFGRQNDEVSKKILINLKKTSNKLVFFLSNNKSNYIPQKFKKIKKNQFDYLISYRSYIIFNENLLKKIKKFSINFHPGPPNYRGTGCVNYAIFNKEEYYGCTAHIINKKIDSGKIIDFRKFKIKKNMSIETILKKCYKNQYLQFLKIVSEIKKNNIDNLIKKNKLIKWSGKIGKKKQLDKFYKINPNIKEKDFNLLLRATKTKKFKPYIKLFNKKFILED